MKESNYSKGQIGEEVAVKFLEENKYEIIERNWKFSRNEIDIIAIDSKSNELVIAEVKYRKSTYHGDPQDAVDLKKRKVLVETANKFVENSDYDLEVRFDIIAINGESGENIEHFEDAFDASEV